jgi:uncharacterized protein YfcZ (UPF0381/DUF406 family)
MATNTKTTGSNTTQSNGTQAAKRIKSKCIKPMVVGQKINETTDACGAFVDIGKLIEANDTLLVVHFNGHKSKAGAARLQLKAEQKFKNVTASMKVMDDDVILSLNFEYTVEKLIFQLEESL